MLFAKTLAIAIVGLASMACAAPVELRMRRCLNLDARAQLTFRSCQRDNRRGEFNRCEAARNAKHQDQARLDADRARRDRDRQKLERDRANGDWRRVERDRERLDRDRNNIRGDKQNINRDGRRECNNLSPRPKYVYVGPMSAVLGHER
jgi:hypothetical protein